MVYVWFKSYDGDNLEDVGLVVAASDEDVYDRLYQSHGYDNTGDDNITYIPLDELLQQLQFNGVISLMDKYMDM